MQAFNKWGTYTFETDFMRQTIGFGEPVFRGPEFVGFDATQNASILHLEIWLEFVPEVYKNKCREIAVNAATSLIGERINNLSLDVLINKIKQKINDELEPSLD